MAGDGTDEVGRARPVKRRTPVKPRPPVERIVQLSKCHCGPGRDGRQPQEDSAEATRKTKKMGTLQAQVWRRLRPGSTLSNLSRGMGTPDEAALGTVRLTSSFAKTGTATDPARPQRRAWSLRNALLVVPPIVAAYLGYWQVGRREEKIGMLEERQRVMAAEEDAPSEVLFARQDAAVVPEYTKVGVSGRFEESESVFIGPRPRSSMGITEAGYFMVTPMYVDGDAGKPVMVLRGWVPESWKKRHAEKPGLGSTKSVRGVVRYSERPSRFVPENCPRQRDWYYVDVPGLARAMGLPEWTHLIEVVTSSDGLMQYGGKAKASAMDILAGKTTVRQIHEERDEERYPIPKSLGDMQHFSVMPRDHLNYALTWFSLSAATSGLAWKILSRSKRL